MNGNETLKNKNLPTLVGESVNDTLDRLKGLGWQAFEVKISTNRERSCWISPEGNWYNVPFADHQIFAYYVAKEHMMSISSVVHKL